MEISHNIFLVVYCFSISSLLKYVFYTCLGQRPLPPLVLSSPASRLALNASQQVMAVTCRGNVSVWDIMKAKALVRNESLLPVMQAEPGKL
jgi:hypothetical protein